LLCVGQEASPPIQSDDLLRCGQIVGSIAQFVMGLCHTGAHRRAVQFGH
jgi:hypothetical protein